MLLIFMLRRYVKGDVVDTAPHPETADVFNNLIDQFSQCIQMTSDKFTIPFTERVLCTECVVMGCDNPSLDINPCELFFNANLASSPPPSAIHKVMQSGRIADLFQRGRDAEFPRLYVMLPEGKGSGWFSSWLKEKWRLHLLCDSC